MTKKEKMLEMLTNYLQYVMNTNVHQKPTAGINSGAEGRGLEKAVNFRFGLLDRSAKVQGANCFDCVKYANINGKKKRITIEIKSGCGTLATLDSEGNILTSPLLKSDFIAYVPQFYPELEVDKQVLFFETSVFMDILKNNGLIRKKTSGKMTAQKKAGFDWFYDILSIQSFKNSRKKLSSFTQDLFFEGLPFDDFIEEYNITIK